jgi:hypothetical protein
MAPPAHLVEDHAVLEKADLGLQGTAVEKEV